MANGLMCEENFPVTPKLRRDSDSENTPPEVLEGFNKMCDLMCTEVIDDKELQKPVFNPAPVQNRQPLVTMSFNYPPVRADCDKIILRDDRVLQNLLRNEERYSPCQPHYFRTVQVEVKPHMRKIVSDWMLEVCQELCCQPEVFCLAMNYMDRFLAICRISKSQLQLLGAACLFLASKFKALEHISSEKLVMYTDFSVTGQELKDWELLVLHKLRWELSATTAFDYLDHIIPRLALPHVVDLHRLRLKTETIIALATTDYKFTNYPPSLVAASGILTALRSCASERQCATKLETILSNESVQSTAVSSIDNKLLRETKTCLQILSHAGGEALEQCCLHMVETLPDYLTGMAKPLPASPDTTGIALSSPRASTPPCTPCTPACSVMTSTPAAASADAPGCSRQEGYDYSSAVDVFSDFNSSVLQAVLSPNDASHISNSILVT